MSKSASLRAGDIRALFLLAGESRELGHESLAWRRHFSGRLCALVGADAALNGEMAGCRAGRNDDLGVDFWWPRGFEPPKFWGEHMGRFRDDGATRR